MKLVSIQIAARRSIVLPDRTIQTGIFKEPVPQADVGELGLQGDYVADQRHHGGPDQAVYVYSMEDYQWWESELGQALPAGTFGENLTFSTFGEHEVMIGDRWRIGDVVLETTAPRIPCLVLGSRMSDGRFPKAFRAARRPGFYARVIETGRVESPGPVVREPSGSGLSLMELFDLVYDTNASAAVLDRVLAAPIAERGRVDFERRLARIG
jgi:MOSC domain-containing protein YiiM